MKKINRLISIIIIFSFLTSSVGIPIYIHICEKSGAHFFSKCPDCSHEMKEVDCCGNPETKDNYKDKFNCCADEVIIAKADIQLNYEQVFEIIKFTNVQIVNFYKIDPIKNNFYILISSIFIPPKDFGKHLIIKKSEFKIDLLSC